MNYRWTKRCLHLLVLGYIAMALILGLSFFHREIFPVFSWSLFSTVAEKKAEFAVLVTGMDGKTLETPLEFMESEGTFPGAGSIRAYYTIQNLGAATLRRRGDDIERLRRVFEQNYLASEGREVHYRLIFRSFDPVERWRGGSYTFRPVADFRVVEDGR